MQATRLFQIIYILLQKGSVTAGELARHFEVSRRTIYRDIDTLSLAGIPVYTSKGRGGGICLLPGFVLDKSLLSDTEQDDILAALQGFTAVGSGDSASVLNKLNVFFGKNAVPWLKVDFSDWGDSNRDLFDTLKSAILHRRVVMFDYYSALGEKSKRRVEPIQIRFKDRAWYMYGYCLYRSDYRTFKLTRMQNITITDETFSLRFPEPVITEESENNHKNKYVSLTLRFAPEVAYRVYDEFCGLPIEKEGDGSFIVSVTWHWDDWVGGFILSFGESVEVLQPAWVQNYVREKAEIIAARYR